MGLKAENETNSLVLKYHHNKDTAMGESINRNLNIMPVLFFVSKCVEKSDPVYGRGPGYLTMFARS